MSFTHRPGNLPLFISIILHIFLGMLFLYQPGLPGKGSPPRVTKVSVITPELLKALQKRQQIVQEPASPTAPPRISTSLQAEKDRRAEKEQVKRGQNGARTSKPSPSSALKNAQSPQAASTLVTNTKETVPKTGRKNTETDDNKRERQPTSQPKIIPPPAEQRHRPKKTLDLSLNQNKLIEKYSKDETPQSKSQSKGAQRKTVKPFSRPEGSGAQFLGLLPGTADVLPDLPDGDLTLLNAKANKYAVFVRRVATRVFASLRQTGWLSLSRRAIVSVRSETVVSVKLSKQGRILAIEIEGNSGSPAFDEAVKAASRQSRDPNPPESAALADGHIYLEFHARTWSEIVGGGRNNFSRERRWLYLGTALK